MKRQTTGLFARVMALLRRRDGEQNMRLIRDIRRSLQAFSQKASAMNGSYEQEKRQIALLLDAAGQLEPSSDITAAKLEQDILMRITETSSACDSVIVGKDGAEFRQRLSSLQQLVRQRGALAARG